MSFELKKKWKETVAAVSEQFGEELELKSIIFLIGVQELNKGYMKFTKEQKLEVMHIAICTLFRPYGYYKFIGRDEEGWPHFENTKKMPAMKDSEQNLLMKEAIIKYFEKMGTI